MGSITADVKICQQLHNTSIEAPRAHGKLTGPASSVHTMSRRMINLNELPSLGTLPFLNARRTIKLLTEHCSNATLTPDQMELPATNLLDKSPPLRGDFVGKTKVCPTNGNTQLTPIRRGPWDEKEDRVLLHHVACVGEKSWNTIKERYGLRRSGKSCRLRYRNHLRPDLKKEPFSELEERLMMWLQRKHGNKWALIAKHMPGRTDNEIKNAWHTKRRHEERERRKAQKFAAEAAVRSGVRLPGAPSCESFVIDDALRATCSEGKIGTVQAKGTRVYARRAPVEMVQIDRKVLQDLLCAEQIPDLATDRANDNCGADDVALGIPVILPGQAMADGSFPAMWSPFIQCTGGHLGGEPCSKYTPPSGTSTGFIRGVEIPGAAPLVTFPTLPRGERETAEAFPVERPADPTSIPGASPALDVHRPVASSVVDIDCCLVACRHVAKLESGASTDTDIPGGPVSGGIPLGSAAVEAYAENGAGYGTRPATSACSIAQSEPSVSEAIAPTRKGHRAPPKLVIPPDVPMEDDAVWADQLFLSPFGHFGNKLSPVGSPLPGGLFGPGSSPRLPSPVMCWKEIGTGNVEWPLNVRSMETSVKDPDFFGGTPTKNLQKWTGIFPGSFPRPEALDADLESDVLRNFNRSADCARDSEWRA